MTPPVRRRVATKPIKPAAPTREPSDPRTCQSCGTLYRFVYGRAGEQVQMIDEATGRPHREVCSGSKADPRSPWGKVAACSTCDALILWATTVNGKPMPVDACMHNHGNVTLSLDGGVLRAAVGKPAERAGFVSHFATCGQAGEHRRRERVAAVAKEAAIEQADDHAPDEWKVRALAIVHDLCRHMTAFTADDVWDAGLSIPPTPSALGGILRRAGSLGYCEPTDKMVPTRFARRHHDVRVWHSKIAEPRADLAFEPVAAVPDDGLDFAPVAGLDFAPIS